VKGTVEVLADRGMLLAEKSAGDYFGEVALVVKNTRRTAYVRAKTYVILAALTQAKLDEALVSNPVQLARMEDRIRTFHNIPKPGDPPSPKGIERVTSQDHLDAPPEIENWRADDEGFGFAEPKSPGRDNASETTEKSAFMV
jgi:hypothetical protein